MSVRNLKFLFSVTKSTISCMLVCWNIISQSYQHNLKTQIENRRQHFYDLPLEGEGYAVFLCFLLNVYFLTLSYDSVIYKHYFRCKDPSSRALCLGRNICPEPEVSCFGSNMLSANSRDVCTPSRVSLSGLTPTKVKWLDHARQQLPQGIGTYQTHKS